MIHATDIPLCRRHHRAVHEGRVKVGASRGGAALFFTRTGRILVDVPERSRPMMRSNEDSSPPPALADRPVPARWGDPSLPPVATGDPGLPPVPAGDPDLLSNGAALYPDSAIPWAIEAAAREAVEESL